MGGGGGGGDGNAIKIKLKLNSAWKACEGSRCVGNTAEDFCVYFVTNFGDVCFGLEGGDNIVSYVYERLYLCYSSVWKCVFSQSYFVYSRGAIKIRVCSIIVIG